MQKPEEWSLQPAESKRAHQHDSHLKFLMYFQNNVLIFLNAKFYTLSIVSHCKIIKFVHICNTCICVACNIHIYQALYLQVPIGVICACVTSMHVCMFTVR